jgi:single-strand DNA-binding protein
MNKSILIGHVGKDPEIRYSQAGDAIANFSLATSEKWKDKKTGEKKEKTEWHQVVAYSPLAEVVSKYVMKGKQVYVEGPSHTEEWVDRAGNKRNATKVTAKQLELLGGGTRSDDDEERPEPVSAGRKQEAAHGDDDEIPF